MELVRLLVLSVLQLTPAADAVPAAPAAAAAGSADGKGWTCAGWPPRHNSGTAATRCVPYAPTTVVSTVLTTTMKDWE